MTWLVYADIIVKMSDLKRDKIKYVRDRAKSAYKKAGFCYICNKTENLDFHHYHTMTVMFDKWLKDNKIVIRTVDDILGVRDKFIEEKHDEVYNQTVTLCHPHHMQLHSIYGKDPALSTAEKQKRWVEKQREKHGNST